MKPAWLTGIIINARCVAIKLIVAGLVMILSGCGGLLFYPSKQWLRTPDELGVRYRDITIASHDGTALSAWWLEAEGPLQGTVLFLHGNAENISTHLGSVYWLPEQGYQVLMVDYRGYGHSKGSPSLPAVLDDIDAAIGYLFQQPGVEQHAVFALAQSLGASMGGYVIASRADYREKFDAVVLDAGFTGYPEIAKDITSSHWLTWLFQYPVAWGMPSQYNLIDVVAQLSPTPLLLIHSRQDAVIPYQHSENLLAAAGEPKAMLRYDGAHITTFKNLGNRQLLLQYWQRAAAGKLAQ